MRVSVSRATQGAVADGGADAAVIDMIDEPEPSDEEDGAHSQGSFGRLRSGGGLRVGFAPAPAAALMPEPDLAAPDEAATSFTLLFPGWTIRSVERKSGANAGRKDKLFISPQGKKFNSVAKALHRRCHLAGMLLCRRPLPEALHSSRRLH